MSFSFPPPSPPPPAAANIGDGTQPQYNTIGNGINANADVFNDTSPPPQSPSSSIIIFIIVIASAIIVSASIYLLLRFLSRRRQQRRAFRSSSATVPEEILPRHRSNNNNISGQRGVFESLPMFTFGSVTGNLSAGDCAVCLSKFEAEDQLRLLPICCHAFHAHCIDTWLSSNMTCPLCRTAVNTTDSEDLTKILTEENARINRNGNFDSNGGSFRIEIGSISRRRGESESGRRSYSVGSFDYIIDDGYEVSFDSTHRRGQSGISIDKESVDVASTAPPGESLAREVGGGRSWLRDYFDRLGSSFRSSGRYSGRQSEVVVPVEELEGERMGEEITELFRWLSGV